MRSYHCSSSERQRSLANGTLIMCPDARPERTSLEGGLLRHAASFGRR